jgi:hypothetical protein
MVTHPPVPVIVENNLWDLVDGRLLFGLDMVVDKKIPVPA